MNVVFDIGSTVTCTIGKLNDPCYEKAAFVTVLGHKLMPRGNPLFLVKHNARNIIGRATLAFSDNDDSGTPEVQLVCNAVAAFGILGNNRTFEQAVKMIF